MAGEADELAEGQEIVVEIDTETQDIAVDPAPPPVDPKAPLNVEVEAVVKPPVEQREDPTIELRRQLEELSRKAEDERRAREAEVTKRAEAEAFALRIAREAEQKDADLIEARIQAVTSAISAEEAEMERAEALLRHANSKRDVTLQTQAQKAMIAIQQRMKDLKDGQEALANQRETLSKRPPIVAPRVEATPDREQVLSRYSPRTQTYLRSRDASWLSDPKQQNMLRSAHFAAVAADLKPDTDAYFEAIDRHMGKTSDPAPTPAPAQREPLPVSKSTPAAPPTAKAASLPTGNKITVKLTPSQVEAAKSMGLTAAEYAKRVHLMSQPGWNGPRFGSNSN